MTQLFRRVVVIVLDGVGVGALPDAACYGDADAATLQHVAAAVGGLNLPRLQALGLGRIAEIKGVDPVSRPLGCWGKMQEQSPGKDSVTGHWELMGVVLKKGFATYPKGFPAEVIETFTAVAGVRPLGNIAASGTDILRQLGAEHLRTGRPIVYTSTDSVFQIAAHEKVMSPEQLYALCRKVFDALSPYRICRVIARPFTGDDVDSFHRTDGRHDFPHHPPDPTLLDLLQHHGVITCGIGKIEDLLAGQGLSLSYPTVNNDQGMAAILQVMAEDKAAFLLANLVDFDMVYGHRCDAEGFAQALRDLDAWLPQLLASLKNDDLLLITADHGCDPVTAGTDHTREFVPLLAFSPVFTASIDLGVRASFADLAATVAENFGIMNIAGESFLSALTFVAGNSSGALR